MARKFGGMQAELAGKRQAWQGREQAIAVDLGAALKRISTYALRVWWRRRDGASSTRNSVPLTAGMLNATGKQPHSWFAKLCG